MNRISVMIVDDQAMIRDIISKGFEVCEFVDIVFKASSGREALDYLKENNACIDIVLLDIIMPEEHGTEILRKIKALYPNIKVIMLTSMIKSKYIIKALEYGADGYVYKDIHFCNLFCTIKSVHKGKFCANEKMNEEIKKCKEYIINKNSLINSFSNLTRREFEIVAMISKGKCNVDIAHELFLSERTVKNHIHNILKKVNLQDRTQIAITNLKYKIVEKSIKY